VAEKLGRSPDFGREKAMALAHAALDPGPVVALPPRPARIDLERGKVFYANNCAACHDPDGRARLREDLVDNDENPIKARDLTLAVFKGGNGEEDVAMRIIRGIPGSPMPGNPAVSADDLWSVVAYVKGLAKGDDKPSAVAEGQRVP
jgi:mono/diheme cytochrome c family protein